MLNSKNEIWKKLIGFEGRYEVSNFGQIRSILSNHGKYQEKLKTLRRRSKTCPYLYVQLSVMDTPYHEAVHRAVAKAFVPNPESKPMVNHKDGNKLNNNAYNLEWVTCTENHNHAYSLGLRNSNGVAKFHKGKKRGKSSNYYNVTWDASRSKWKAALKEKGKMVFQKRFDSEIEAAKYVNSKLDELGYSDRPRNVFT